MRRALRVRYLGEADYVATVERMKSYASQRDEHADDELWILQHAAVFTQGQAGKAEHVLNPGNIPVVQTDRGGQVTYHGPGQYVIYVLIDIARLGIGVRDFVSALEQSIVDLLAEYEVLAVARRDAPGVYVGDKKIASVGLRVRQGRSYHGVSLNVDMDLLPFASINPCGYAGMAMTQLLDELNESQRQLWDESKLPERWLSHIQSRLGFAELVYDGSSEKAYTAD